MDQIPAMPEGLQAMLQGWSFCVNTTGHSSSNVYRVTSPRGAEAAYLKVQQASEDDNLQQERDVLLWLQGRLPVPQVLHFSQQEDMQYMLISEIAGAMAADSCFVAKGFGAAACMARLLAKGLRMVHSIDVTDCPLQRPLDRVLEEAGKRVSLCLVDAEDLQPENYGRAPEDILQQLIADRPAVDDLVFTHGDYCLPNIILRGDTVSGLIDWGRAGVADRYADIALAIRSLKYNLGLEYGSELADLFLQEYGLEHVDHAKIAYYILLDELF